MGKYIIVYEIDDYSDNGGGKDYELYDNETSMLAGVNVMNEDERFNILFCGQISKEIEFEAVEVVTKFKIKE